MRVLVLTNHFSEFAGSETIALEVAQWFIDRGDQVALAANLIRQPMSDIAQAIELRTDIQDIDLSSFDLVWCQHNQLSMLPIATIAAAAASPPLVALVSLSPFEPYEHLDGLLANAISANIFANSPETADDLARRNQGLVGRNRAVVFYNAAPQAFWRSPPPSPTTLRTLTIVSNHIPPELAAAKPRLEERGIVIRHMGLQHDYRRLATSDLDESDAVVTIGKSVVYSIARGRPVFIYDHFGGDGWLTRANFDHNLAHNFSGRPTERRLQVEALVHEIIEGFEHAVSEMRALREERDLTMLRLDTYLAPLREQALKSKRWRALRLQWALASRAFRAHLELARQNSLIMRRSYLLANGATLTDRDHHPNLLSNRVKGDSSA